MLYTEQIQRLKSQLDGARTLKQCESIEAKILKLAKEYNSREYKDFYLIIDGTVYGLELRCLKNNYGNL